MDVMSRLTEVFQEVFEDDDLVLSETTSAADIPEWDSIMHVSLLLAVEGEFDVTFNTSEVSGMKNVGDLKTMLTERGAS